jgi:serine/threonine-protein kinase HSL1, negative regulator of Swe1 kinase
MAKPQQVPTLTIENRPIQEGNSILSRPMVVTHPPTSNRASASSQPSTSLALNPIKSCIGPWQLGQNVGAGAVGKVRQVRHVMTGQTAAAKIISKGTANKVCARSLANLVSRVGNGDYEMAGDFALPLSLEREIVIMRLLEHHNIARIYDVWENCDEVYLILEYINGCDLFSYLASEAAPLDEQHAIYLFRQLVEALLYCHRFQICHRDLKPENIMLDTENHIIKVIDFGMAAFQPTGNLLKTPCGSPHYAAPELLYGRPYDGSKADVWSLACVLFSMLTGGPPFNYPHDIPSEHKLNYLYDLIKAAQVKIPSSLSKEARDLFKRVFVTDPRKRIDVFDMWRHPLLHKFDNIFGYEDQSIEHYIGPTPSVVDWAPLTSDTIDQNIFRNLLMLWHDSDEPALVTKLCNNE